MLPEIIGERTKRVLSLCGGLVGEITVFDFDHLAKNSGRYPSESVIVTAREMTDLNYLSTLSSRHRLAVVPPAHLPSTDAPVLTLDRDGFLSVYVGRADCAVPGKDISIFRPTSGGEESIDVGIITQLLVSILEERKSDGTMIFEAFGDGIRKFKAPDEVLVVVVDCSKSMSKKSDFTDVHGDDEDLAGHEDNLGSNNDPTDRIVVVNPTLDDIKGE